jgi:type II secretory pathway component GspD/PulD (secretin)
LTKRETTMLTCLLRSEAEKEVLSRPQVLALDGQTAFIQIGQPVELVTGLEAAFKDGTTVYTPKKTKFNLGMTLQVTPKISKDGKSISLQASAYYRALAGTPVQLPVTSGGRQDDSEEGVRPASCLLCLGEPTENVQTLEGTVKVADGGTAVLGGMVVSPAPCADRMPAELLWILTACRVESGKQ